LELIAEFLGLILKPIISGIIEISFEVGYIVCGILSIKSKKKDKNQITTLQRFLLSLLGGLITIAISILIIILIFKF